MSDTVHKIGKTFHHFSTHRTSLNLDLNKNLLPCNIKVCRLVRRKLYYIRKTVRHIRKIESRFPPDCLIIARLSFSKERIGHGTHLLRFLTEVARKHGFNHIGIECANDKSSAFTKKLGFYAIDGENFVIAVSGLIDYFSKVYSELETPMPSPALDKFLPF